ncbi:berberine bridge enzyme-like 18 [Gossypium arboreum]|uniref:berberine bridge enzyme-like 18 n=1 Tax=Gossypium arboreum TaxID=29729 RepID=UPI0022F197AD|nr:berberine bridge enzyme-like 18 [Gossypium arboreum]
MEGLSYIADASFVVIDLVNLKSVDVDVKSRTAWVESGATVGELQYRIAEKSGTLDFPTCTCHTVGVGGYFSGGGHGPLSRNTLVHVPSTVTVFTVTKAPQQNAMQVVHRWQYIAPKLSDDTFILATISRAEASEGQRSIQVTFRALFLGRSDILVSLMEKQFPELGLLKQDCIEMSWIRSVVYFAQFTT